MIFLQCIKNTLYIRLLYIYGFKSITDTQVYLLYMLICNLHVHLYWSPAVFNLQDTKCLI